MYEKAAPPTFDILYEQYFDHVKWLLRHHGVPAYRVEDDAQDIFVAFYVNDILGQFDPTVMATHDGKQFHTTFRQFVSVKVERYARGKRDKAQRAMRREVLVSDMTPKGAEQPTAPVFTPITEDDLTGPEIEYTIQAIRSHLEKQPVIGMRDLSRLFELIVDQTGDGYVLPDRAQILRRWSTETVYVPGVVMPVTAFDIADAVEVLVGSPGVKILPYLEAIESPLASATDYKDYDDGEGRKKPGYIDHLQSLLLRLGGAALVTEERVVSVEAPGVPSSTTLGSMMHELRGAVDTVMG